MKKYTLYILVLMIALFMGVTSPVRADFVRHCAVGGPTDPNPKCSTKQFGACPLGYVERANAQQELGCRLPGDTDAVLSPAVEAQNSTLSYPTPEGPIDSRYHLLAPLPSVPADFDPGQKNALGVYLNLMLKAFIGICAVLSVVMIVLGGMEYMTSELISSKESGKSKITNAIFGLLLALGAYALLYTINPDLLQTDLPSLTDATVSVDLNGQVQISGALSRTGAVSKIDLKKDAYPAAKNAANATGLDPALILAIFAQETGSNANTGSCTPSNANMYPADIAALTQIVGSANLNSTHVSCPGPGGGHGGAIGGMQFLPSTWLQYGGSGDPWNVNDALMAGAKKLKADGGGNDPYQAACKYFGKCSFGGIDYAAQVVAKMGSLQTQIAEAKQKGEIS